MSLIDALLLDPPKFDVWIALRTDGVLGSGTQADPYDGSAIKTATLDLTLSNPGSNKLEAIAVTGSNHGFVDNDIVVFLTHQIPPTGTGGMGHLKSMERAGIRSSTSCNASRFPHRRRIVGPRNT